MYKYIMIVMILFLLLPIMFGVMEFFGGVKYIHSPEPKRELLILYKKLIQEGNIIQGFPRNNLSVSYYLSTNRNWFYPKIYDYFYKWAVYYRFKWYNRC